MGASASGRARSRGGPAPRQRPLALVALDAASLVVFAASAACVLARLDTAAPAAWWPALALAALAGVCAADLATGAAHWLFDGFFDESTPGLGPAFVRPFREHHRDPAAIVRHGFLEVSGNNALALSPLLWLAAPLAGGFGHAFATSAGLAFGLAAIAAAFVSNQIHRWAHAERVPHAVRWLQRRRWILSPEAHARHHVGAHDRAYCVATGWMNPLADGLGLFRALERVLGERGAPRARS
jgi:ubiquitin-conjugating enzyme E2 variant